MAFINQYKRLLEQYQLNEKVEVFLTDTEKKFLTYFVNNITREGNERKFGQGRRPLTKLSINASNFTRLFKIPSDSYFLYNLEYPSDKKLTEDDIKKIERICNFSINGMRGSGGQYNMGWILSNIDKDDRIDKGVRIMGIVFARLVEFYAKEDKNFKKLLLKRSMKPDTAKHFGDIFEATGWTDNKEPSLSEVINFKFTKEEQQIADTTAKFLMSNRGYSYLGDLKKDYNYEVKLYNQVQRQMGGYLKEAYQHDTVKEAVEYFLGRTFLQPYMSLKLFVNLFINNSDIDPEDITGIVSVPTNPPKPNLENIQKWVIDGNTSGFVNVTGYYFAYYVHKPETVKKVTELLLKHAILHDLKDTNYMRDRMMSKQSKKEFEGII